MKKLLLPISMVLFSLYVIGQNQALVNTAVKHPVPAKPGDKQGQIVQSEIELPAPVTAAAPSPNPLERIIGGTTYDLQSNSGVGGRIENLGNGEIVAVWTFSNDFGSGLLFTDRGTGYAYSDGSSWNDDPQERVESKRIGWPSIVTLANKKEFIVCHNTDAQIEDLQITSRATVGSGLWTEDVTSLTSPSPDGNWWPRAIAGGNDGNSLHIISLTYPINPTTNDGSLYQGLDGAITYSRSSDGGSTWDVEHDILTGMTSAKYVGFSADDYDWANSVGDTIAFVVGGLFQDIFLMKSEDNGDTWTKTMVHQFHTPLFDETHHIITDTALSNDGSVSVILDNDGMAHVFFGGVPVMNDDTTDAQFSSFPNLSALYYWNESYGSNPPDSIAGMVDRDGDMIAGIADFESISNGYTNSLASQPSAGIDADGNLYLVYNAVAEDLSDGNHNYRHIYLTKSTDGGSTWTPAVDLNYTLEDDVTENVFASLAHHVDDYLHIVYQRDFEAGMAVRPEPGDHLVTSNEIVYVKVPTELNVGMAEETILQSSFTLYPNPANDNVTLNFGMEKPETVVVSIYDVTGKLVNTFSNQANAGTNQLTLNVSGLNSGVYFVNAIVGQERVSKKLIVE